MLRSKNRLAVAITLATISLFAISIKSKQMFDKFEHLNQMVESQSSEINQLRITIDEHESEIDELKSQIENLESER